ncbi:peptide methionine sulfoxide reductase MsrA [Amylocystis lapponica]|nr:peptide methionine sulfoxide reductase MsrA [Amylocystis lapponica]
MFTAINRLRLTLLSLAPLSRPPASLHTRGISSTTMSGSKPEIATFAAGCFWGVEHIFLQHYPIAQHKGILKTSVGYTGGKEDAANPDYRLVCTGTTDHAEALRIEFDPEVVKYDELVEFFYRTHDPTTLNSQGKDSGTQYRSAIFYHSPVQLEIAKRVTEEVQKKHIDPLGKKIVTQIVSAGPWWDAEDYHQEYLHKNPSGYQCPTHRLNW